MKGISLSVALVLASTLYAAEPAAPKPRIAVVLDDFGLNYKSTPPDEEWGGLPFKLTFAVMPRSPRTKLAAKYIKTTSKEMIIHFPFDPFLKLELPKGGAVSEKDTEAVAALLEESFKTIPGASGLNTHRSLKATQNRALMSWFMKRYKGLGLFFLDSAVSPKTLAYDEALAAGIPAAKNNLFLEPAKPSLAQCRKVLRMAANLAKKKGHAVVIGHHYHRSTLDCLKEDVPKLQGEGFEFVFASEIAAKR
jgi:hypothetical protein